MSPQEAYRVLGLTPPVSEHDITRAFRRVVQTAHPDRQGGSAEAFQAAGAAREVLLDSVRAATPPPTPPPHRGSSEPPPPHPGPGPEAPSSTAQDDAEGPGRPGQAWGPRDDPGADTGPIFRPIADRVMAPRTWRVDVPLAAGGVLAYALLLGLSLLVSSTAVMVTAASAAVLVLGSVVWSALGRVRQLPDGWPRFGEQERPEPDEDGPPW